jgi:signal transduction histidine kinase
VIIGALLGDVAATLAPKARKRSIEIECTVEVGLPDVQGDADRLRQVFVNLVDNAVKFSPEGSIIHVTAGPQALDESSDEDGFSLMQPSRRMIEVNVIDSGIGIPEEERERIFDAFYQVDSSSTREHEGTGLGLSIVKRLVDGHGGTVRVSANEPTGAIFSVVLPAAPHKTALGTPGRRPG